MKPIPLALVGLIACGSGHEPTGHEPTGQHSRPGDERVIGNDPLLVEGTLANGVRFAILPIAGAQRAHLRLVVAAGSLAEDDDQQGIAHLVEHLAFEGTTRFPGHAIQDFIERTGMQFGSDANAETGFDSTVYRLSVPTDRPGALTTGLDVLRDWAGDVTFAPAAIDHERRVVLEERRLRAAPHAFDTQVLDQLVRGTRYAARFPIGDPDVVAHAPREVLLRFYRDWYRPDLITVVAVGDFDARAIEQEIRTRFDAMTAPAQRRPLPQTEVHVRDGLVTFSTDDAGQEAMGAVLEQRPRPRARTIGDLRARVADELRVRVADLDRARSMFPTSRSELVLGDELVTIATGRAHLVLIELQWAREGILDLADLARARREIIADSARIDDPSVRAEALAGGLATRALHGDWVLDQPTWNGWVRALAPTIEADEVARPPRGPVAFVMRHSRSAASESPEDRTDVEDVYRSQFEPARRASPDSEASASERALHRQRPPDPPPHPSDLPVPPPGSVVATRRFDAQGVTEWTLSNGARVVLKRMTTSDHSVRLQAVAPGGAALASPAQWIAAQVSPALVVVPADRGAADRTDVGARVEVLPGSIRIYASARSSADVESMLRVVVASVVDPRPARADGEPLGEVFDAPIRVPGTTTLSELDAELWRVASADDPLQGPTPPRARETASAADAVSFYREHVADLGGYTFVLSGDVDPATLAPLLARNLAGTPPTGGSRGASAIDFHWGTGDATIERRSAETGDRSEVHVYAWTDAPSDYRARYDVDLLTWIVANRMHRLLRDELAEVYATSIQRVQMEAPAHGWLLSMSFSCAPANAKPLAIALRRELGSLRDGAIDVDEVVKAQEQQRRATEAAQYDPTYWRSQLAEAYARGADAAAVDPDAMIPRPAPSDAVALEHVRAVARHYLSFTGTATGILHPASVAK